MIASHVKDWARYFRHSARRRSEGHSAWFSALPWVPVFVLGVLALSAAQEQSVKPGINDSFADPDIDRFIKTFEGESRAIYAHRQEIVDAIGVEKGTDIADVGAGTGFFTRMFARETGREGTVYGVDIAKNFVKHIKKEAKKAKLKNVKAVLCTERSVELRADSVDLVYVCDTYHHFEYPFDTLASIHRALRPGGSLIIVDFERIEGVSSDWVLGHVRCGKETTRDEIVSAGFEFVREIPLMEEQYVLEFRKGE